jgi:hypothetical protein
MRHREPGPDYYIAAYETNKLVTLCVYSEAGDVLQSHFAGDLKN